MRSFTNNFLTQAANQSALPYLVLEVDWGGPAGVQYYLDRSPTSFVNNDGYRFPAGGVGSVLVVDWGHIGISLKEGEIGVTDQTTVTLDDTGGAITNILNSVDQQRRQFTIWRMFDDPSVKWDTDNGRIFTGVLRPFSWSASDNQIVLNLGDLGPLLAKDVSLIATDAAFDKLPPSSKQKSIPLCWGRAQRVEALPISAPWETRLAQSTDGSNPVTVNITDDLSLLPGVVAETPYDGYVGTDPVTITFHQSPDPTSELSTATLDAGSAPVIALISNLLFIVSDEAGDRFIFNFTPSQISPSSAQQAILADSAGLEAPYIQSGSAGTNLVITLGNVDESGFPVSGTVRFSPGDWDFVSGNTYDTTWWQVTLQDNADGTLAYLKSNNMLFNLKVTGPSAAISVWPAGTTLRPKDQTTIYAVNALPSKAVLIVEGCGTISDSAGDARKDFIVLGQVVNSFVQNSSATIVVSDYFSVNCNDSTWSDPSKLGRNITTITFQSSPRDWVPNLNDNRIWCTVLGIDDAGDGSGNLITNPATVILQYLENAHLMDVDPNFIDANSFSTAADGLSGFSVGFAQLETRRGLDLLQEIAMQCNSVLLLDQGVARMVVLSDTAGTVVGTFDTTTLNNYELDSLVTDETAVEDGANELIGLWTAFWDDITGNTPMEVHASKAGSITAFGPISRELPIYLHWRRGDVETAVGWWLDHFSTVFRTVTFTAYLGALVLEPGDWITVSWVDSSGRDLFGGAQSMMVVKATDRGADQLVDIEARYPKSVFAS
ncbi:MAG TPA: hypothetical protein VMV10_10225 [Pirellulales bacterium]|nr:hypothetical protein [Pirellulales bacterium]